VTSHTSALGTGRHILTEPPMHMTPSLPSDDSTTWHTHFFTCSFIDSSVRWSWSVERCVTLVLSIGGHRHVMCGEAATQPHHSHSMSSARTLQVVSTTVHPLRTHLLGCIKFLDQSDAISLIRTWYRKPYAARWRK
jgi:hypothetical protein